MKTIVKLLFIGLLVSIFSCQESELIIPESEQTSGGVLQTRPSLRPDSVKVFPAFYRSVDVVFPLEQPERAVKSVISYINEEDQKVEIIVTDFNEVVTINNLALREYEFQIVYLNELDIPSSSVKHKVTPYDDLPIYAYNSLSGYGSAGTVYIDWENITGKEVEVAVRYTDNDEPEVITKRSNNLRDTISINNLPNTNHTFEVVVTDLSKPSSSSVRTLTIAPGITAQQYAMNSLEVVPGNGRAFFTWDNPSGTNLKLTLSYSDGGSPVTQHFTSSAVGGSATFKGIPEGVRSISATFTNVANAKTSTTNIFTPTILKGIAKTILDGLVLKSYGNNYASVQGNNTFSTAASMRVVFEKSSGATFDENFNVSGLSKINIPLKEVKVNAVITVYVTDDVSTVNKTFNSTVLAANLAGIQLDRTGWTASASSERTAGIAAQVLDGIYGGSSDVANGWVNQWEASKAEPADPVTGTKSNVFPHYIQVDMLSVKYVTGIRTINHNNGTQNGAGEFIIQYSIDGITFYDAQTYSRIPLTGRNADLSYVLNTPVLARFVRYYATQNDNSATNVIRMGEFYVNGLD